MKHLFAAPGILHPESRPLAIWDFVVLGFAIVSTIVTSSSLALDWHLRGLLFGFEILVSLVFTVDIVLMFRRAYFNKHALVTDAATIKRRYLRSGFVLDLLAAVPFFLVPRSGYLVLNRILRITRASRIFKIVSGTRGISRFKRSRLNPNLTRLVLMIFWLLFAAHLIATGMIAVHGVDPFLPDGLRYLQALYWTITTLATVGYGDITPDPENPLQLIFTIVTQLLGVGMYGYVIGNISTVIARMDLAKTQFREKMEKVKTFLKYRNIPDPLSSRIVDYYSYLWETRRGYDEVAVLDDLPAGLRLEVVQELHRDIIAKVPLFKDASAMFRRDIVAHLVPEVFTPGDTIVRKGEIGDCMYFIGRGSVDVVSEDASITYATLGEGSYFGEIALLLSTERNATIKTREYCDLYSLNKASFEQVLAKYSDFASRVRELAEKRRLETEAAAGGGSPSAKKPK